MQGSSRSGFVRAASAFALSSLVTLSALADSSSLAPADSSATVTGSSAVSMDFPITRSGDLGYDAYVSYRTADDSAVAGTDYTASSGSVLIPAGASSATVSVPVLGSSTPKSDRAFKLDVLAAAGVGPTPAFAPAVSSAVGSRPNSVAVGDFNGDGRPDLAVANTASSTVSILFDSTAPGESSASFTLAATPTVGSQPVFVAVGDFNGDGKPDLVTANYNGNNVSILLNSTPPGASSASFTLAASPGVGAQPYSVAVGDFNGDGKPDLAVANYNSNKVSILFNSTAPGASSASFTLAASPGVGAQPRSVAVGDFNGDGKPDLAVANASSNSVSILLNSTAPGASSASFTLAASPAVGKYPYSVAVADINGDGMPDLAVANAGDNTVAILLNGSAPGASSASFTLAASPAVGSQPVAVAVSDLNGDGKPDLATANYGGNAVSVLLNSTAPGSASASFTLASYAVGSNPASVAVSDFNGDGKPDLAAAIDSSNRVSVLLNTTPAPTAGFALAASAGVSGLYDPVTTAAGDFNGDGKPDLAVVGYSNDDLWVLLNSTAPGASSASFTPTALTDPGSYPTSVAVGDFNGDGRSDLAVANTYSRNVSIYFNNTVPGASSASFTLVASPQAGNNPCAVATGDFNGDGKLDLAVANRDGEVAILFNGTAPGASGASFTLDVSASAFGLELCCVAVGDFNGDGKPDLAVANLDTNTVSILLNEIAPGSSTASLASPVDLAVGSTPRSVTVGDFNGDGRPDLAVANGGSSAVSVLLNTTAPGAGSASFALGASVPVGVYSSAVAAGDFDGDGRLDLAVANNSTTVSILLNRTAPGASTASFTLVASSRTGDYPSAVAIGDFNGDGRPDLATVDRGEGYGGVSVLLSTQYQASASGSATGTIHYRIPVATLSASALDFGSQTVGTSSTARNLQLGNSGNAPLAISSIAASGDFAQTSNCPASLAPAAQCVISVVFKPTATGARSGTLSVITNAPGSPAVASLSGNGVVKYDTQLTAYPVLGTLLPLQLNLNVSALLQALQPAVAPLAGKTIVFTTASGQPICTASTDASGKAACPGTGLLSVLLGGGSYRASFAGDANYNASSASAPLLALTP